MSAVACPRCDSTDICGHEVRGVYDGVLFWTCDECGRAWSRDLSGYGRRQEFADNCVAQWNDRTDDAVSS